MLIFPDNLTVEQLVKENQDLKYEIQDILSKNVHCNDDSGNVAITLRSIIQDHVKEEPWPPLPSDLTDATEYIPADLHSFLKVLLTGKRGEVVPSEKVARAASSIGQDIVYSVNSGRRKPPKHILLPFAVKSLTGNVELVKIVGHGVSYDQLQEIDTALCIEKLNRFEDNVPIPECIQPNIPTTLA